MADEEESYDRIISMEESEDDMFNSPPPFPQQQQSRKRVRDDEFEEEYNELNMIVIDDGGDDEDGDDKQTSTPTKTSKSRQHTNKVPMMTDEAEQILSSYTNPSKSNQPLNQVYDKQWKVLSKNLAESVDAMDIDDPTPSAPSTAPSTFKSDIIDMKMPPPPRLIKPQKKALIVDDPKSTIAEEGNGYTIKSTSSTNGTTMASIMSPTMLNERHHYIAEQTSKILNESATRKLLAVDKAAFEGNAEATALINLAMEDFKKLCSSHNVQIFNPSHVPTTTTDGTGIPNIPELNRVKIIPYLRAPIFKNHEVCCSKGDNCVGHRLMLHYITKTAKNPMAGPQFPPNTQSFALRAFYLPQVESDIKRRVQNGESMAEVMRSIPPSLCYLDTLDVTNHWVVTAASRNEPLTTPVLLQTFSIKIGVPGEYNEHALLTCGSNNFYGLVAPYPEFRYNNYFPYVYTVEVSGGKETVFGWAEVDEILCEPSLALKPRGYDGHAPMPAGVYSQQYAAADSAGY
jgi:hypothetical protein